MRDLYRDSTPLPPACEDCGGSGMVWESEVGANVVCYCPAGADVLDRINDALSRAHRNGA